MTHAVTPYPNGKWKQNCYVVASEAGRQALLIDPGSDAKGIRQLLSDQGLTPLAIMNTHGHYDHIGAVADLAGHYEIPFYIHHADARLLKQANLYKLLFDSKESVVIPEPTHDLAQCDAPLTLGDFEISVLSTPGHTKGSICLRIGSDLFTGDTLFHAGPGRADLPGGDKVALAQSVEFLRGLPGSLMARPGHGRAFSLSSLWERLAHEGQGE